MRKLVTALFIASCCLGALPGAVSAGTYTAGGQFVGTVNPQVAAAFAAYKNGGSLETLVVAIITLVKADPSLASDVIYLAVKSGNADLQITMASALADAYTALIAAGQDAGATLVMNAAQLSLVPIFQTQLTSAAGSNNGGGSLYPGQTNSNPLSLNTSCSRPVSPAGLSSC